ncbi:MAG: FAD-dependent oxidoreductase [Pseudomonadota bacterium]
MTNPTIEVWDGPSDEVYVADVLIIGAGGCGLTAALAACDAGVEVVVLEQSKTPLGTTSMSTGLIPAAGTPEQRAENIADTAKQFFDDIMAKNKSGADPAIVERLCEISAETVRWLRDDHHVPLTLVEGFTYPGHSARRMYGTHNRTGEELMAALETAAIAAGASVLTEATATVLLIDDDTTIQGVRYTRPDGSTEEIGCHALVLACCGFAANAALISKHIPELEHAVPHTHSASQGLATTWGASIGAEMADMDAYQGHAGLAAGHSIPILWPSIMEGGVQVNRRGERFSNEARGYSEQAATVLAQPQRTVWSVFDERIERVLLQFNDYRDAKSAGAIVRAEDLTSLADAIAVDQSALETTFAAVDEAIKTGTADPYGRHFDPSHKLAPPYLAVKVTGAIFHTQGGLCVDATARVLRQDGSAFANLFAGGGAARGISGSGAAGYLAGNGLLTATSLGRIAGDQAARQSQKA